MSPELLRLVVPLAVYVVLVVIVGVVATRRSGRSPEEYFLAGRKLSTLVLFMALFGTNATAFIFVGIPGRAYHQGIGVFSINAAIVALGTPLTFYLIGGPARRWAKKLQALTPAELYAKKLGSPLLGAVMFGLFTVYTLPYMVSAVVGAAVTLHGVAGGAFPQWAAGLTVVTVALVYTTLGGMRATAWTNVLQGLIFMVVLVLAFFFVVHGFGGPAASMRAVLEHDPGLLEVRHEGPFAPGRWVSWGLLISLTVIAFPHMLVRLMAADSDRALRGVCRLYPPAMLVLWLVPVLIGVWGAVEFPGLVGRESDRIFQMMVDHHLPRLLAGLGSMAVLAAVMSSLDAMILTLSSMLVRDVLDRLSPGRRDHADVVAGRTFAIVVAAVVYLLSLVWQRSVASMAALAFSGYTTMVPVLLLGLRWKRFNAAAAFASLGAGAAVLYPLGLAGLTPLGFEPVFWALLAATATALLVPLAGPRSRRA